MANPTWPASLPSPTDEGMSYAPLIDNVITTPMETGAPKRRRRFTAVPDKAMVTLVLTRDQVATLRNFVEVTLADVLPFDWTDFRDGSAATYVFTKRPTYMLFAVGANLWKTSIELQMQ